MPSMNRPCLPKTDVVSTAVLLPAYGPPDVSGIQGPHTLILGQPPRPRLVSELRRGLQALR